MLIAHFRPMLITSGLLLSMVLMVGCVADQDGARSAAPVAEEAGEVSSESADDAVDLAESAESITDVGGDNADGQLVGDWGPNGYCASAAYRCTRVEFTNALGFGVLLEANGHEQGSFNGRFADGTKKAVTGYRGSWGGYDINGTVNYVDFVARNPQVGYPCVGFTFWSEQEQSMQSAKDNCRRLSEGETTTFTGLFQNVKAVVKREANTSNMIEFTVVPSRG